VFLLPIYWKLVIFDSRVVYQSKWKFHELPFAVNPLLSPSAYCLIAVDPPLALCTGIDQYSAQMLVWGKAT
jgi:hypothetical protein